MTSRLLRVALFLACAPGGPSAQQRDPDRGLDAALRERLALVDPALDSWPVERWAALVEARLERVERLWSEDGLASLAAEAWVAPELRAGVLFATDGDSTLTRRSGEWSVLRSSGAPAAGASAPERGLAPALVEWRAAFRGAARLDFEVLAIPGDGPELEAELRLTASGVNEAGRVQHNARWSTTWRLSRSDPAAVELLGVRVLAFEAVVLAARPDGLFTDVTRSVLGNGPLGDELARGLDDWRASVPAQLEPGSLGHHGLALGDVDGDGLEDVYLCRPGGLPNRLLVHTSDDGVRDVSAASGTDLLDYSSCALLLDLDGDDDLDLVASTSSGLACFANDGRARFEQRTFLARSLATSLAAADYDLDGDLDFYACSYISPFEKSGTPVPYHDAENGEPNQLLRNDGEWRLVDATAATGLDENNRRFSLAAAWEDFDQDGDPDLCVANDFGRNHLYRNERADGAARFRDVAAELWALEPAAGMGVTWGDVDGDGWVDLYLTNMHCAAGMRLTARPDFRPGSSAEIVQAYRHHARGNTLLRNRAGHALVDVSEASGTALGRWGWGAIFLDLDDDGALDLFAPNGFVTGERDEDLDGFFWRQVVLQSPDAAGAPDAGYQLGWKAVRRLVRQGWSWNGSERNVAFLNLGETRFADVSSAAGLDHADDARAAARVDWDGDGDEDLLVTNRTGPMLRWLRNERDPGRRWIDFTLSGAGRTAIGARVELTTASGRRLVRTLGCGEGYLAQSSARVHFGLGSEDVQRVAVRWPGARELEEFGSPESGRHHSLERGKGRARALPARTTPSRLAAGALVPPPPPDSARTVLPATLPLPRLALESGDGRATSLFGITMQGPRGTGQPLLLVPWSSSVPECRRELERLARAQELRHDPADAEVRALQILALNVDPLDARARALDELAELAWPFAHGFASEEALQILELVYAALHDDARSLSLPAAFLIDPGGLLVATYRGRLEPARLRADLGLFALSPEARRDACVPFSGRWIAPPPGSFGGEIAARLAAHGLERAAGEYAVAQVEVREVASAQAHYELGVARQREGRFAEAVTNYRKALEIDPGHLRAAQNIGVALHQLGELPAALDAYKLALKLDPGHARTRSNLGHLYLDLGDLQGAKNELAALRSLESDLAPTLEERIRQTEERGD